MRFSLRTNRKRLAGTADPDRDEQFRYLTRLRRLYITLGLPVISVDTKKKEWVGNFKNPGRCWRRGERAVLDHDFPSWALGRAIPVGVYDVAVGDGYVSVGTSHDTPAFTAAAIRRWWLDVGRGRYPEARRLLIEADGGGPTDPRKWGWKVGLQELADELGRWENDSIEEIAIVIGGQDGISSEVAARAQKRWRLSRLTLTHEMARVVAVEQLYRAYTINRGLPYQK